MRYATLPPCTSLLGENTTLGRTSDHVQIETVAVLTVAAPRLPEVSDGRFLNSSNLRDLREKIRLVYRMAPYNGKRVLVLGATGRDAYGCPPRQVAKEMKAILFDEEFVG
ncbi:hypothetical protein BDM02DRAFT_3189011 [Thelephora ganbajun]|uniref:Uncharacterized protein n=1 Tax=Thelephora ganbajun TaxID=370292 RepID=A0ACB6Z9F1_THEGA|nr:hypothetical protein BDM02DRAFT_3189011 [Thelephora ganbajun]